MEVFRDEIQFVLSSIDVSGDKPFEFLKRFSNAIALRKGTTLNYDSTNSFGNFCGSYSQDLAWCKALWNATSSQ
jgi:hypothetical protein